MIYHQSMLICFSLLLRAPMLLRLLNVVIMSHQLEIALSCVCIYSTDKWDQLTKRNWISYYNRIDELFIFLLGKCFLSRLCCMFFVERLFCCVCVFSVAIRAEIERHNVRVERKQFLGFRFFSDIGNYLNSSTKMFRSASHTVRLWETRKIFE